MIKLYPLHIPLDLTSLIWYTGITSYGEERV